MSSTIKLNVGGTLMETYESTLSQLDFFNSYISRWNEKQEPLFLDLDPKLFRHILNKLRDSSYELPNDLNLKHMSNYIGLHNPINLPFILINQVKSTSHINYKVNTDKYRILDIVLIDDGHLQDLKFSKGNLDIYNISEYTLHIYFDYKHEHTGGTKIYTLKHTYLQRLQRYGNIEIELYAKLNNHYTQIGELRLECLLSSY